MTTTTDRRESTFARYMDRIVSGEAFALKARSLDSVIGYQPVATARGYAHAMTTLGRMAGHSEALAQVSGAIFGHVNQYATGYEAAAQIYRAAFGALAQGFTDVRNLASPEPGRYRDNQRQYSTGERLAVMVYLDEAVRHLTNETTTPGWCLARALDDHHLGHLPEQVAARAR